MGSLKNMLFLFCLLFSAFYSHATSFSITQGPSPVIQGEPSGDLSFTIKGSSNQKKIIRVRFTLPSQYLVCSHTAPDNWSAVINPSNVIEFQAASSSDGADKNVAKTFIITVTGTDGNIPPAADDDSTHALTNIEAWDSSSPTPQPCDFTGGQTNWLRRGLYTELYIEPASLMVNDTALFWVCVQNRTTSVQTAAPVLPSLLTDATVYGKKGAKRAASSGGMTYVSGPQPGSQSIQPGEIREFTYVYRASRSGNVTYKSGANNGSAVTSNECLSNEVSIGALGGWLEVPLTVGNGEIFTVAYHVVNNADYAINQIEPQPLTIIESTGIDRVDCLSGPNPPGPVLTINPGGEIIFYWEYQAFGIPGSQFRFRGSVRSLEEGTTTRDQTNWTTITTFSASAAPELVLVGDQNVSFEFNIFNGGRTTDYVNSIVIYHPDTVFSQSPGHFISCGGGNNAGWTYTLYPDRVEFIAPSGDRLMGQDDMKLYLNYNIPDKTWYPNEIPKTFRTNIGGTVGGSALTEYKLLNFLVTNRTVEISVSPQDTEAASPFDADGVSFFDVKARLLQDVNPMTGRTVSFTCTADPDVQLIMPPEISPLTAVTSADGFANVLLRAPRYELDSPPEFNVAVTASYQNITASYPDLRFRYYRIPTITLLKLEAKRGNSAWNIVKNFSFLPGETGIAFRPALGIIGSQEITVYRSVIRNGVTSYTTFEFSDAEDNGNTLYRTNMRLSQQSSINKYLEIEFDSGQIPAGMIYGHYKPKITIQYRAFGVLQDPLVIEGVKPDDKIQIGSVNQGIRIINWREKQENIQS